MSQIHFASGSPLFRTAALQKSRFTLTAVISLGLGMGAATFEVAMVLDVNRSKPQRLTCGDCVLARRPFESLRVILKNSIWLSLLFGAAFGSGQAKSGLENTLRTKYEHQVLRLRGFCVDSRLQLDGTNSRQGSSGNLDAIKRRDSEGEGSSQQSRVDRIPRCGSL